MPLPDFSFQDPITDTIDVPTKPASETQLRQLLQGPSNELATLYTNFIKPLVDSLEAKLKSASCKVNQVGSLSLASSVSTMVPFASESWDTDNMHDNAVNNTRLTCNTAGDYFINGKIQLDGNATGIRWLEIVINGALIPAWINLPGIGGTPQQISISTEWKLNAGDYVELRVTQSTGGSLNVTSSQFGMVRIPN